MEPQCKFTMKKLRGRNVSMLRRILELIYVSIKINKYIFHIILKIYFHIYPMDFFLHQEMLINSGGDRRLVKAQSLIFFFYNIPLVKLGRFKF